MFVWLLWQFCLRVWFPLSIPRVCAQTLVGHGGTVTAVAATRGCVVSCSVDGTLRVWRAERDRQLLLYPSFVYVGHGVLFDAVMACFITCCPLPVSCSVSSFRFHQGLWIVSQTTYPWIHFLFRVTC
jgi:hypothetical protein